MSVAATAIRTVVSIEVSSFRSAFSEAAAVAPTRSPKAILQNVLFDFDPERGSELIATDLEKGLRIRLIGVKADAPGRLVLPRFRFAEILKTTRDSELILELEGDTLHVGGLRSRYKLTTEDATLYPDVPDFTAAEYVSLAAKDLRDAITRTVFATDVESTRYALGGCLFEFGETQLTIVATDGRRLAQQVCPIEWEGGAASPASPVIPTAALSALKRQVHDDDPPVHIAQTKTAVNFRTERAVLSTRLVEGRFPRYQDVFPAAVEKFTTRFQVGELAAAIDQSRITTSEESRGVDWLLKDGLLTMSGVASDVGSSEVEMPVEWPHKPLTFTIDPRYVIDALRALDEADEIDMEAIDEKNAIVYRSGTYTYVVMPLIRDRQ